MAKCPLRKLVLMWFSNYGLHINHIFVIENWDTSEQRALSDKCDSYLTWNMRLFLLSIAAVSPETI